MGEQASIKIRQNGQVRRLILTLPASLYEVPLNRYIDYVVALRGIDTAPESKQLLQITEALSAFYGVPLSEFLMADYGGPINDNGTLVDTVNKLFGYTSKLIADAVNTLKSDGICLFEHAGANWHIPAIIQGTLSGALLPEISVIQAVEALEVQRRAVMQYESSADAEMRARIFRAAEIPAASEVKKALEEAAQSVYESERTANADPSGNEMFTRYVRLLALFARRVNADGTPDAMPMPDNERTNWIDDRMLHFAGGEFVPCVSAAAAIKVDFFLSNMLLASKRNLPPIGFLIASLFGILGATRLQFAPNKKAIKGQRKKQKKRLGVSATIR